jgi:iron-sulfur cluster assembly accessory protein
MVASPVNLTDNAKNYLQNTAINSGKEYVWFGVEGGGCTGFQYKWDFIDDPDPSDYKLSIGHDPSDMREIFLIVDIVSEMHVLGSTIDYVQELGGSFLKVINPVATSSCGCGESFGV